MADQMPGQEAIRAADVPPATRAKEREILDRIRDTFAEKGFDGASMQALARAAGMSVGNFYRYFPSKAAMVAAIVTRDLEDVEAHFAAISAAQDPMAALREVLHQRIIYECHGCDAAPLWAEISAAALRKPEIGAIVGQMEREIARYLTAAFGLAVGVPPDEAATRFAAHGQMAVMLVKATAMQGRSQNGSSEQLTALALRMVDTLLDEIEDERAKV